MPVDLTTTWSLSSILADPTTWSDARGFSAPRLVVDQGVRGRSPRSLAHRTLLPARRKAGVPNPLGPAVLTLKPKVGRGKAVISVNPIPLVEPDRRPMTDGLSPAELVTRAQVNKKRSVMRSRGLLMDYAQEYGLGYLWTLTWAPDASGKGQSDWQAMVSQVRRFQERLSETFPGMPYVIVPEWHPGGYGIHLHMGVGQFIHYSVINALWGHGRTHSPRAKNLRGKVAPADCARYLAKYVSKTLGIAGLQGKRFWRPHGQTVTIVRHRFSSTVEAEGYAVAFFGGELPAETWSSDDAEDWSGPPVTVLDWNARRRPGGQDA